MENDFNVDIVNNETGEVYAESLQLSAAHARIEAMGWEHVETTSEDIPGENLGGGEEPFILYTLWVTDPEETAYEKSLEDAKLWWDYKNGGGRVHQ